MGHAALLNQLQEAIDRIVAVARRVPGDAVVPSYPSHDVASLVGHVADVLERVDRGLSTGRFDRSPPKPPVSDRDDAIAQLRQSSRDAVRALRRTPAQTRLVHAFTTLPATASMYPCYLAVEVVIHRWDMETALGEHTPIDTELAVVAIDNLFEAWMPLRRADTTGVEPLRVLVETSDVSRCWTVTADESGISAVPGTDSHDASVRGSAADLMLLLWKRIQVDSPVFHVVGDYAAVDRLLALGYVPDPRRT